MIDQFPEATDIDTRKRARNDSDEADCSEKNKRKQK